MALNQTDSVSFSFFIYGMRNSIKGSKLFFYFILMRVHILSQCNLSKDRDDFYYFSEFMVSQKLGGIVNIRGLRSKRIIIT